MSDANHSTPGPAPLDPGRIADAARSQTAAALARGAAALPSSSGVRRALGTTIGEFHGKTCARGETLIQFENIHKAFGDNVIYRDMNLDIRLGETLTIIGGSGEGKSVCLKLMIGLLRAEAGRVLYYGEDVGEMNAEQLREIRMRVSMVFQGGALFDSMTIVQNVGYALREHTDMGDEEIEARAVESLTLVGLGPADHPGIMEQIPAALSVGMRKRVALARSIAQRPEVILYDEPTTGLDPSNCNRIARMIRKLQRELGVTSIVVTHDMTTAWYVADRVAMLYDKSFPFVDEVEAFRAIDDPRVRNFIEGRTG
ncbi:putative phospholipid import ATP-binding protein MlaF [Enhygromyxa salina]|uniref:Putative phospholipid import ATP-binding protein MlaF n=1 Tax=Enhygromyxa salina TaxID=215803 RepID=A0A2S9XLN0_9BACT|nr:ATP-binding cassette domain-containing protein [Enhygromyxa salina]PRP93786.1 putative phospholipid import ATP-binding protein MlaF [Enhygromyxa salina]